MLTKPVSHLAATDPAGGKIEHKTLLGIDGGSISVPLRTRKVSMEACPTRLLPSTKGWLSTNEKQSAAAFSARVG